MTQLELLQRLRDMGARTVELKEKHVTMVEFYPQMPEVPELDTTDIDVLEDLKRKEREARERLMYGSA